MQSPPPPPTLSEMFITSVDTLHGTEIDQRVTPGWNDRPPLLKQQGNWRNRGVEKPEDPALLKGMLRKGVPPALRCAVWLSNVVSSVHPHQPPEYAHEYRTLAKVRALDMAYQNLLQRTIDGANNNTAANAAGNIDLKDEAAWKDLVTPVFGRKPKEETAEGDNVPLPVKRVLIGLDQVFMGVIEYSPILPTICELLLTHMDEAYAFCTMREMAHAPNWFFPTSRREYAAWVNAFCDILERLHPGTALFFRHQGVWTVDGMAPIFQDFFTNILPLKCVYRILDLYTLEGCKVIFRFGVALLVLFKMEQSRGNGNTTSIYSSIRDATNLRGSNLSDSVAAATEEDHVELTGSVSKEEGQENHQQIDDTRSKDSDNSEEKMDVWEALKVWTHDERFNFDFLVKKAYGVHGTRRPRRFPRRNILSRIIKMEEERLLEDPSFDASEAPASRPLEMEPPFIHPLFDLDELGYYKHEGNPPVPQLAHSTASRIQLATWLPLSLRMTKMQLLFSTNYHGRMLEMFYNRVSHCKHTLFLAEVFVPNHHHQPADNNSGEETKTVIGCYASHAWKVSKEVYGDGECFLFRLSPNPQAWKWSPRKSDGNIGTTASFDLEDGSEKIDAYAKDTALLEQFMVSTHRYISMGGNLDGSCGLRFNEDLTRAETTTAVGFDNEPLAGVECGKDLDIGVVEVYGLVRPS